MTAAGELGLVAFTVGVALGATALILPLGIAAGWLLAAWRGPGKQVLETFLSLPLVLPPTSVGLLLLEVVGPQGPVGRLLGHLGVEVLFTWKAAVLASAVMSFPLLVRAFADALAQVEPRLMWVARSLGDSPTKAFLRVAVPLAWRGILGGVVLAFARALGEFGATILVAGNIPGRTQTLALAIFERVENGEDASAMRLVAITTGLAFVALWIAGLVQARQARRFVS